MSYHIENIRDPLGLLITLSDNGISEITSTDVVLGMIGFHTHIMRYLHINSILEGILLVIEYWY